MYASPYICTLLYMHTRHTYIFIRPTHAYVCIAGIFIYAYLYMYTTKVPRGALIPIQNFHIKKYEYVRNPHIYIHKHMSIYTRTYKHM